MYWHQKHTDTALHRSYCRVSHILKHHHLPLFSVWRWSFSPSIHLSSLRCIHDPTLIIIISSSLTPCLDSMLISSSLCGFLSPHNQTAVSNTEEVCSGQNISIKKCELEKKRKGFHVPTCPWAGLAWLGAGWVSTHRPGKVRRQHSFAQPAHLKDSSAGLCSWPQQNTCLKWRQNAKLERVQKNRVTITQCWTTATATQSLQSFVHGCLIGKGPGWARLSNVSSSALTFSVESRPNHDGLKRRVRSNSDILNHTFRARKHKEFHCPGTIQLTYVLWLFFASAHAWRHLDSPYSKYRGSWKSGITPGASPG